MQTHWDSRLRHRALQDQRRHITRVFWQEDKGKLAVVQCIWIQSLLRRVYLHSFIDTIVGIFIILNYIATNILIMYTTPQAHERVTEQCFAHLYLNSTVHQPYFPSRATRFAKHRKVYFQLRYHYLLHQKRAHSIRLPRAAKS